MHRHTDLFYLDDLQELFVDVQLNRIFPDQKTFADCTPRFPVADILEDYREQKKQGDMDLLRFVEEHFDMPQPKPQPRGESSLPIEEHIEQLWDILTRKPEAGKGTIIPLPKSSIVPGGRFREIFYWDTYFTMLGLQVSGRMQQVEDMIDNFAYLIDQFGLIPNGNRTYFLTRSQPPFFSHMIQLLRQEKGDQVLLTYLPQLTAEYNFWMHGATLLSSTDTSSERAVYLQNGILNRYWEPLNTPRLEGYAADVHTHEHAIADPSEHYRHVRGACESGWDFSGRWFADGKSIHTIHTCDLIPVDLNSLLWHLETTLSEAYALDGKMHTAEDFGTKAKQRQQLINEYCWDEELQTYCDYDFVQGRSAACPTMAMAYPLFCGLVAPDRASKVLERMQKDFLKEGGLVTTLTDTGQQWDAPNGWAPLQWIGYVAAKNYRADELAQSIARKWTSNVEGIFARTGKLMEKYNVLDLTKLAKGGEYLNQDGFGWTNGVYLRLKQPQQKPRNV